MVHDILTQQRTECPQTDVISSPPSGAPKSLPIQESTFEHEENTRINTRKRDSFIRRHLGSARSQATEKDKKRGPLGLRSLFCALEPLVDIVFVHGLGGGSIKTWCFNEDQDHFWPQRWLPKEPELINASIHTFGYDSDWRSTTPSILNVHDFGQSLYQELLASPFLRQNSRQSPIILVGHSMGGIVIKKAYVLAQQNRTHSQLSERIRCIFFLATPHRGSDYAELLDRILRFCGITGLTSPREYIRDLTKGADSAWRINNEFAGFAQELTVYTFCETLPTTKRLSTLIVSKDSAILGINPKNEHVQFLDANHRNVCKFQSESDSNYIKLKNALATAVENLIKDEVIVVNDLTAKDQMYKVQELLHIQHVPEEHHDKVEGSCRWIEDREDFQAWFGAESENLSARAYGPSIFWVQANPGAGKTVLAAHVISRLTHLQRAHASYYFHFGKKATQSLAGLLLSISFQMASANAAIRAKLAELHAMGASFDQDDARSIWTKIFVGGIFQVSVTVSQFWIIDALDECVKYSEFFTFLKDLQSKFPLRIFMTSRRLPDVSRLTRMLEGCETTIIQIPVDDTMRDIEHYVRSRITDLPIDEEEEREEFAQQILSKSDTSFLWVRLVMDELEGVYSYDSIIDVLQKIPEGMLSYYGRAVTEMSVKKRERHIAKAILLWVMLATRPLSISELSHALDLDINVHLPSAKSAIEGLCGQLVSVDVHTGLVQPVHATAREFLLSEEAGDFRISKTQGHERISLICLQLLTGPQMQPPRHRSLLDQKRTEPSKSGLADYAITQFQEHVYGASIESDKLLLELDVFLRTTVLTWIEKIMIKKEVYHLIRTAKNLKACLDRRTKYHSLPNQCVNNIEAWVTDLSRVAVSFCRALIDYPQSVYFLIPPLCPTQSAMFRQFGRLTDGLMLSGYCRSNWSDCVANIRFEDQTAAAIGCGNSAIAIGTDSGKINFYNLRSFQKEKTINSGYPVDLIHFDPFGSFVATCSRKFVELWNMDGTPRWKTRIRSRCILISSSQSALIGVTQQGRSSQWDLNTGELINEQSYTYQAPDWELSSQASIGKAPSWASLSPGRELLALAYRNSPVCIFGFSSGSLIGWAIDEKNRAPEHIIFNPNPDISKLLVAYNESHLSLYDPWSGALMDSSKAERPAIPTSVTCSPDGRTFATMDILGHLRIWDFETLNLLYYVLTPSHSFGLLHFTSDGLGLIHIMDHEMRIWAPSALVRKTVEEEASLSDQSPVLPVTEGQFEKFQASRIKALIPHPSRSFLFTGNYNGDVVVYQAINNHEPSTLYSHKDVVVKCLAASNHNVIASADMHANVQVWRFDVLQPKCVQIKDLVLQVHFSSPVFQLLFDASGMHLLVSTAESDHVYSTEDGSHLGSINSQVRSQSAWRWFVISEPSYREHFLLMVDHAIIAYSAKEISAVPRKICQISYEYVETSIDSITHLPSTRCIIVEIHRSQSQAYTFVFILPNWDSSEIASVTTPIGIFPSGLCAQFVGISQSSKRMVFLQPESWICSVDLRELEAGQYVQHFFVPEEYGSLNSDVRAVQTFDGDIAFCLYDKIVVMKNGLKFQTQRALS